MADRTWWMGVLSSLEQLLKQVLNLKISKMKSSKEPIFKDTKFKETMKPHITCRFCVVVCFLVVYFLEGPRDSRPVKCMWGISTFVSLWQWSFTEPSETNSIVPRSMVPPGRSTSRWGYFCWGCFACGSTAEIKVHSCFILTCEKSNIHTWVFLIFVRRLAYLQQQNLPLGMVIDSHGSISSSHFTYQMCKCHPNTGSLITWLAIMYFESAGVLNIISVPTDQPIRWYKSMVVRSQISLWILVLCQMCWSHWSPCRLCLIDTWWHGETEKQEKT